ncbi:hypothetical protein KLP28_13495 [Nocardioidaceae bacterium]|nr:hypothetical protein KLP28_13495 [Nocardioidaceae bacterium]
MTLPGPGDQPALPGRFVRERETIESTVAAILESKLGYRHERSLDLHPLGVYDAPDRDPRGWTMSVAHATALPRGAAEQLSSASKLIPVAGPAVRDRRVTAEPLAYDHDEMVTTAVRRMRRRYEGRPDPDGLLTAPFSLRQLREAHEAVLHAGLQRDTFARRMRERLIHARAEDGTAILSSAAVGRPARLFVPGKGDGLEPGGLPRA